MWAGQYKATFMKKLDESPQQVRVGEEYLDLSASERINSYIKILEDIKNRPILGYGATDYGFIDGQFLRTLIETGFVGFAAFLYLLYKVLY
jgi:O-antigen ligase